MQKMLMLARHALARPSGAPRLAMRAVARPAALRLAGSHVRWCAASRGGVIGETKEEKKRRYDATAGKPTAVCDPYENEGKPLSAAQCAQMLPAVSDAWTLADDHSSLVREIEVDNFMKGAKLLTTLAAVSFNDGHYASLTLERRVGRGRRWQELVSVRCQTAVLGGLSFRDFQLAMLMDVELARPE